MVEDLSMYEIVDPLNKAIIRTGTDASGNTFSAYEVSDQFASPDLVNSIKGMIAIPEVTIGGILFPNHKVLFNDVNIPHRYISKIYSEFPESDCAAFAFWSPLLKNDPDLLVFGFSNNSGDRVKELLGFLKKTWPDDLTDISIAAVINYNNDNNPPVFTGSMQKLKSSHEIQ